jgi:C4-dicarboxylate-binding protein DctP
MRIVALTGGAFAIALATSASVLSQEAVVLSFPHEAAETTIKGMTISRFAELVEEHSGGSVRVEVFAGGQLIPAPEETRAAIRGQVDLVAPQTSYFSSLDDIFDVYYQPLLFGSFEEAMTFVDGELGQELLTRLERFGLIGLETWHDGPGYLFIKGNPILDVADIAGQRIRIFPSNPLEQGVRASGAVPISMPAADVFLSLQQGVVDGVITTPTYAGPTGWGEALDSMTRMMMFMGGYGVVMNADAWNDLSEDQQAAVRRAMTEASQWNIEAALGNIDAAEARLIADGVTLHDLTPEQLAAWQTVMEPVYAQQGEELQALIARIRGE